MNHLLVNVLRADLAAGLRVLRERDRLPISDAQIRERANNLTMAILGSYDVRPLADDEGESALDSIDSVPQRATAYMVVDAADARADPTHRV